MEAGFRPEKIVNRVGTGTGKRDAWHLRIRISWEEGYLQKLWNLNGESGIVIEIDFSNLRGGNGLVENFHIAGQIGRLKDLSP